MQQGSIKFSFSILLTGFFFLSFTSIGFAQDLLVKVNGDTLSIVVVEIQKSFLVYTKTDLGEERVFTTVRKKLDRIIYKNGDEFVFEDEPYIADRKTQEEEKKAIQRTELNNQFLNFRNGFFGPSVRRNGISLNATQVRYIYGFNDEALYLFNTGRTYNIIGNIIGIPFGYILGDQLGKYFFSRREVKEGLFVAGIMGSFVSVIFSRKGVRDIKKSTKVYNRDVKERKEMKIGFQSTENGVGLVLSF